MWRSVASLFVTPSAAPPALARRLALVVAGFGLAWTVLMGAVMVGLAALYLLLATWLVPVAAAALTAVIAAAAALWGLRGARRAVELPRAAPPAVALIREYPEESLLAALAAGMMVTGMPEVREALVREMVRSG